MDIIADMLETRARIPDCKGLECFEGTDGWFNLAPLETRVRLLRVLLPSVNVFPKFSWKQSFGSCFLEVQAPHLTTFSVWLDNDRTIVSPKVLEVVRELVTFAAGPGSSEDEDEEDEEDIRLSAAPLQSVTTALRNGALCKLQGLKMWSCDIGDGDLRDYIDDLELSGVARVFGVYQL